MSRPLGIHGVGPELTVDRRRLEILERRPQPGGTLQTFDLVLDFGIDTTVSGQETSRFPAPFPFSIVGYRATEDGVTSTTTTVGIRRINTSNVVASTTNITIPASTPIQTGRIAIAIGGGEVVQGVCSTAGSGLAGLLVVLECIA